MVTRKKIFFILALTSILLTACNTSTNSASPNDMDQLKKQVSQLQDENDKLKKQLEAQEQAEAPAPTEPEQPAANTDQPVSDNKPAGNVIELSKPVTITEYCELKLKKAAFTKKVLPPKPEGMYSYYEVKDASNIYLDIIINIKSLATSAKGADEFASVKVKYDNKYDYDSFSTIEESGGTDFTYTMIKKIEPLKSANLHFIAELPKEAEKDNKPIQVIITSNGKDYIYKMR